VSGRFRALRRRLALGGRFALGTLAERVARGWRRRSERLSLEEIQRRLELQLIAVYGQPMAVEPAAQSNHAMDRLRRLIRRDRLVEGIPRLDGDAIKLPVTLAAPHGRAPALARYRLFAIEQAERIVRRTASRAPAHDSLERDLFLLREATTIDAAIARAHPGMIDTLQQERRHALERRPGLQTLTAPERQLELMVREALARPADRYDVALEAPTDTREWARETAARVRASGERYRGVPPAPLWGTIADSAPASDTPIDEYARAGPEVRSTIQLMTGPIGMLDMETRDRRASGSNSRNGDRDAEAGDPDAYASPKPSRDAGPHKHDDARNQYEREPVPGRSGNPGPGATGSTHHSTPEDLPDDLPSAIYYAEWNADRGSYVKRGAAVRLYEPDESDEVQTNAADQILRDHGALVRQIGQQFERLRARRTLLGRQRSGDDLDVEACVHAVVDRRIGGAPDDRLYVASRPARRGLAIALLADTSGSTQTPVSDSIRVIDLERIALLLAAEALDALGDVYAVYSFAGKSAEHVKLTTLKRFDQRNDRTVRQRVSAIAPGGFTRLGAAVRHTTRELARQSAGHRLLLILSDGRPNDVDAYQGTYGVEDSRRAILEARASGVFPFCLTVDANASEYLPRIFGKAGHVIVRRPAQLPSALLTVVSALVRGG
jgi:nitric oxide reductase NorD protein